MWAELVGERFRDILRLLQTEVGAARDVYEAAGSAPVIHIQQRVVQCRTDHVI